MRIWLHLLLSTGKRKRREKNLIPLPTYYISHNEKMVNMSKAAEAWSLLIH